jgi:glutamate synthase (NADPH) large chain
MTGGVVVVLGPIGRNFAAGMTGGVVFACDSRRESISRTTAASLAVEVLTPSEVTMLRDLLSTHARLTGSRLARSILRQDPRLWSFRRIAPAAAAETAALGQSQAVNE